MCVLLFIWFFLMVINFQTWVCKENVCPFIHMVLFYSYKFLKMGIQGNESSFFTWNLKVVRSRLSEVGPKYTTQFFLGFEIFFHWIFCCCCPCCCFVIILCGSRILPILCTVTINSSILQLMEYTLNNFNI